jgi:hypothetical protein
MLTIALIESDNRRAIPDTHWRLVIAHGKARETARLLEREYGATIERQPADAIQERRRYMGLEPAI